MPKKVRIRTKVLLNRTIWQHWCTALCLFIGRRIGRFLKLCIILEDPHWQIPKCQTTCLTSVNLSCMVSLGSDQIPQSNFLCSFTPPTSNWKGSLRLNDLDSYLNLSHHARLFPHKHQGEENMLFLKYFSGLLDHKFKVKYN